MALEDRIRPAVDAALDELRAHVDADVRALVAQLIAGAADDRDDDLKAAREREEALAAARQTEVAAATAEAARRVEEAEKRVRLREREAATAALTRLLEGIRGLDEAATLSDVLDTLARVVSREASRAAVLVVRHDRIVGWKLTGFGPHDGQPKAIDLGVLDGSVASIAVRTTRPVTTRDAGAEALPFAALSSDRLGVAVPVIVGRRAVAVVYADSSANLGQEHQVPERWPEAVEILVRHASRCLEGLTVQKTTGAASPRFWTQAASRPGVSV